MKNEIIYAAAKSLQSCPTLCDPMDCSLPGFSVHGILQARTLERVAISFSNAWKWKVKMKSLSRVRLLACTSATPPALLPTHWFYPSSNSGWLWTPRNSPWPASPFPISMLSHRSRWSHLILLQPGFKPIASLHLFSDPQCLRGPAVITTTGINASQHAP